MSNKETNENNNFKQNSTNLRKVEVLGKHNIESNICLGVTTHSRILETTKCTSEYSLEEFLILKRFFFLFFLWSYLEEMGCVEFLGSGGGDS